MTSEMDFFVSWRLIRLKGSCGCSGSSWPIMTRPGVVATRSITSLPSRSIAWRRMRILVCSWSEPCAMACSISPMVE